MGRGGSTNQLLAFSELQIRPQIKFLQLLFGKDVALELRWDDQEATLEVPYPPLPLLGLTAQMTRVGLSNWLRDVDRSTGSSRGALPFGPFYLSWNPDQTGPSLHAHNPVAQGSTQLGTVASWDTLRDFLNAAKAEGLF